MRSGQGNTITELPIFAELRFNTVKVRRFLFLVFVEKTLYLKGRGRQIQISHLVILCLRQNNCEEQIKIRFKSWQHFTANTNRQRDNNFCLVIAVLSTNINIMINNSATQQKYFKATAPPLCRQKIPPRLTEYNNKNCWDFSKKGVRLILIVIQYISLLSMFFMV